MSTPQSRLQTPAGAPRAPKDNRSFTNLRMELGHNGELLKYLPYNRTTFQAQSELPGAAPERILYGDMMEEKDQLWIYWTLLGGANYTNKGPHGSAKMITFQTLKGAQNGDAPIRPQNVQKIALASAPFKLAGDAFQIMAIAAYFFVRRGVDEKLKTPISLKNYKLELVRACKIYKAVYEQAQAAKNPAQSQAVATAGTVEKAASREVSHVASPSRRSAEFRREPSVFRAPSSVTRSSELLDELYDSRPPSHSGSIGQTRKRARSPAAYPSYQQSLARYPSTPTPDYIYQADSDSLEYPEREVMVDKYVALQAQEEDLDRRINDAEGERSEIAAQIVGFQARLRQTENNKAALMEEKDDIKTEKKDVQSSLNGDEQLEFGFEAGRRMESKRLKRG
ncbi:hypothetical protein HBH70_025820 [Parastagonospora nodorum]|nr:hypothetical protein HBH53_214130 [Parastagonospora nodorum]KAH3958227.1 hypothetical protein HBH51_212270 [Parastagonospora nodorum]KAH3992140.1 hypothetical protein HBI10_222200 [Parastagonospora nodorum]KAH4009634.1 hypothetical protein HBI13_217260 [Parastagonospora nodorum]KAH4043517.1 hypothetical protein HBH49_231350 [Parastagonospora nodorum]